MRKSVVDNPGRLFTFGGDRPDNLALSSRVTSDRACNFQDRRRVIEKIEEAGTN